MKWCRWTRNRERSANSYVDLINLILAQRCRGPIELLKPWNKSLTKKGILSQVNQIWLKNFNEKSDKLNDKLVKKEILATQVSSKLPFTARKSLCYQTNLNTSPKIRKMRSLIAVNHLLWGKAKSVKLPSCLYKLDLALTQCGQLRIPWRYLIICLAIFKVDLPVKMINLPSKRAKNLSYQSHLWPWK